MKLIDLYLASQKTKLSFQHEIYLILYAQTRKSFAHLTHNTCTFFRQIKNRHGQTLAIMNNGEVRGVAEEAPANKNAVLEFIPTEPPGAYRIRGIQANLYLAMDAKGKLYGESDRTEGSTIFAEHTQNMVRNKAF